MRHLAFAAFAVAPVLFLACGGDAESRREPNVVARSLAGDVAERQSARQEPPTLAGIDTAAMDLSVAPCEDFYQYACGSWIKNTEIPADEASWVRSFSTIRDRNEEILHGILEAYAKGEGKGEKYQKELGDFYASCMDEAAIEKQGTKALAPWLKTIDAIMTPASLAKAMGKLQADGMGIALDLGSTQDFVDATKTVAMIWQSGLGMPEREYYLDNGAKMTELRTKYEAHVTAMMQLAGLDEAKAKAASKTVLAIETQIATAWMTKEERREPKKISHPATRADLSKLAPEFAWDAYLDGASQTKIGFFNLAQPDYAKALGELMNGKVSIADWKTYLKWHVFRLNGNELGASFVDEKFRWKAALVGAKALPPRWKRCVREIDASMGEALAQPFVKKTLGAEGKASSSELVQGIEAAMHANLEKLTWMDDNTRKQAFLKLAKIANKIAYPDTFRKYSGLVIDRANYAANAIHASAFEYNRQMAKIGKPLDRTEWGMSPPTVNAYYNAQLNEMVFPAGILQPPFYANASAAPVNFGGIGMVMGHELTHGFDDEGRQFDADGNLKDWWTAPVNVEFERRAACVTKQFDAYTVLGDLHVNGKLTLGENIADLGGVKLAYGAMKAKQDAGSEAQGVEQAFFVSFAQTWCGKFRDEAIRNQVATNPHSPAQYRVNGPLTNLAEFASAFGCKPSAKMVSKNRCEVW